MGGENTLQVTNPATGELAGEVAETSAGALVELMARARAAQPAWAALGFRKRAKLLRLLCARMVRDEDLPRLISTESGKPVFESEFIEILYTAELTRYLSGRAGRAVLTDRARIPFFFPIKRTRTIRHPRGVVGVIGPFNWPLLNNFADAVGPLLAGNAVVLKPSPLTPLTSLRVLQMWQASGLPADVLCVAPGGDAVGATLCELADAILFTGSVSAGHKVADICARRMIPCVLELGGKNPAIVLEDADLEDAAHTLTWGAFVNTGQACVRIERVLVVESVADALVAALARQIDELRQGASTSAVPPDFDLGVLARGLAEARSLQARIAAAQLAGATVVRGGFVPSSAAHGAFTAPASFPPTLVDRVTPDMDLARTECFGPVLAIIRVPDEEAAVRAANALDTGLTASVFSRDRARATALARRLEAGSVCLNDALVQYFCVESPLGGVKLSGLGHRHGAESLLQFTRTQVIVDDRPGLGGLARLVRQQLGFPYRPVVARLLRWLKLRIYG